MYKIKTNIVVGLIVVRFVIGYTNTITVSSRHGSDVQCLGKMEGCVAEGMAWQNVVRSGFDAGRERERMGVGVGGTKPDATPAILVYCIIIVHGSRSTCY